MSGTNKIIVSTMQGASEKALADALLNANEVVAKKEGKKKTNKKK